LYYLFHRLALFTLQFCVHLNKRVSLPWYLGLQGFLQWPTHTAKWPSKSSPPSAAALGSAAAAAVQAWPPSMFFVERSLGPSGRALQSQLMQTRVELMEQRAALLRDRGLREQVPC
jgi:hypothetical protein